MCTWVRLHVSLWGTWCGCWESPRVFCVLCVSCEAGALLLTFQHFLVLTSVALFHEKINYMQTACCSCQSYLCTRERVSTPTRVLFCRKSKITARALSWMFWSFLCQPKAGTSSLQSSARSQTSKVLQCTRIPPRDSTRAWQFPSPSATISSVGFHLSS